MNGGSRIAVAFLSRQRDWPESGLLRLAGECHVGEMLLAFAQCGFRFSRMPPHKIQEEEHSTSGDMDGQKHYPDADGDFYNAPCFNFNDGAVKFNTNHVGNANENYGSASAFLPNPLPAA
ncbi:MAG: hypothetical protein AAB671_02225 [Patescibacteria group bacterium]